MLSLKLVRSLVLGETITNPLLLNQNHHGHDHDDDGSDGDAHVNGHHAHERRRRRRRRKGDSGNSTNKKTPLLLFLPTKEVVKDTYRLATIARDMGMDLYPNPSLSHIIFSWPSSSSSSSSSSPSSLPSLWSSSSSSWPLSTDIIPLPFPSLTTASAAHLRCFAQLSRGLFKLVFYNTSSSDNCSDGDNTSHWDCSSLSLFSRLTGDRVDSMDSFSRVLAGMGWTFFKTKNNPALVSGDSSYGGSNSVYLFRKVDSNRVRARSSNEDANTCGKLRIRELRLPPLDFRNAPLRILQYILLMTDDIFYLA